MQNVLVGTTSKQPIPTPLLHFALLLLQSQPTLHHNTSTLNLPPLPPPHTLINRQEAGHLPRISLLLPAHLSTAVIVYLTHAATRNINRHPVSQAITINALVMDL